MPDSFPSARSVDICGVIQLRIDAGDGSQINNHAVARAGPNVGTPVKAAPNRGIAEEVHRVQTEMLNDVVHNTCRAENLIHNARDNDGGKEIRQIQDCFRCFSEFDIPHLRQQDGQHDRERKAEEQFAEVQHQRIFDCYPEFPRSQSFLEPLQPHPRAVQNALKDIVLFKCHQQAAHRRIPKHQKVQQRNDEHEIQRNHIF